MGSLTTLPGHALSAYDALFINEWPGVVRYFRRAVGDDSLAEDLAQESFLRVAQGLATFRGDSSPRTWLRRIAANVLHDHWRSRGFKDTVWLQPWTADDDLRLAGRQPSPALAVERKEVQACLAGLVAELPPGEREALMAAICQDIPPRDVATNLGLAPEAARARLHRARRKMAAKVADRCVLVADEDGALSCETRAGRAAASAPPSDPIRPS